MTDVLLEDQVLERFHFMVNAPALFQAVATATELGIFTLLDQVPGVDAAAIRQRTGLPAHQLRVLLHAVCTTGLIRRVDGGYRNSDVATRLLARDGPDSWRHILLGWKAIYYPAFAQLTEAVRAGSNIALRGYPGDEPTLYQRLSHQPELEKVFHAAMSAFTLRSLPGLVEAADLSSTRHLLDVGGGAGTTSVALARRHADLRVTVLDAPSVARLAADTVPADLQARVRMRAGDLFADGYPTDVDAVLFSHVLEIFEPDRIRMLLAKAFAALPSGGRVLVYGFNASDDETKGVFSARLSLYLNVLATGRGMAYPGRDYEDWLRTVGFDSVGTVAELPYEHGLTFGTKP
jgi:hypothetical protein